MFSCWYRQIRSTLLEIGRKSGKNHRKPWKKACFHAESEKIRSILLEIVRTWFFPFFRNSEKNIKNHEKSLFWCWFIENWVNFAGNREKMTFAFLMEIGKIIRNREKKHFFSADSDKIRSILLEIGTICHFAFLIKLWKIIRNHVEKTFSCWFRQRNRY